MKRLFPIIAALLYLLPQTVLAEVGDDGLHKQPWFHQSFLELADDVQEAAEEDKFLVVLIEQAGCPYCRELHEVNFKRGEITDYLNEHALVLQLVFVSGVLASRIRSSERKISASPIKMRPI